MIKIDFRELLPQSLLVLVSGNAFVQQVLDDVASSARAKWIRLAQQELRSSKRDYIDAIQDVEGTGLVRTITLVGWMANAVESGMPPTDLKRTLLGPGKGKMSKAGHRYRSIPFGHGTPGSRGQAGTPMGSRMGPQGGSSFAYAAEGVMDKGQAAALGKRLYRAAKRLRKGQTLTAGHAPKLAPWHKTDLFAGMRRTSKQYLSANQGSYQTFRTISEAPGDSVGADRAQWIHPGIQARQLSKQVEDHIRKIIPATISAALRAALGRFH